MVYGNNILKREISTLTGDSSRIDSDFYNPPRDPIILLRTWFERAAELGVREPQGMTLSTVDSFGYPSSRVVLIKEIDNKGLVFGTSKNSTKGRDIEVNPRVSGNFWWRETLQQINFSGRVEKLPSEKSDDIFKRRTRESRAIANASKQSTFLRDERALREEVCKLVKSKNAINRPFSWHAYLIVLEAIEFWVGSTDRLHKRLFYTLEAEVWQHQLLQP